MTEHRIKFFNFSDGLLTVENNFHQLYYQRYDYSIKLCLAFPFSFFFWSIISCSVLVLSRKDLKKGSYLQFFIVRLVQGYLANSEHASSPLLGGLAKFPKQKAEHLFVQ